jgi:2-furoyl-CoA dehydrogenase large subunit
MTADPAAFRFVSTNRRVREDRRFVAGHGQYVADVALEGMLHVAVLSSPHPAARIVSIDASAALAMPGVHYVLTGDELAAATDPLMNGLDTPLVQRHPLAVGQVRYAGEWVAAVVADNRALAEDAVENVDVRYEPLPFVISAEEALKPDSPPVHSAHGSNVLLDRTFVWGEVDKHFADVWASIQMPKYPDQIARALRIPANGVRVHQDVDVGGSYGVKRGIKQTVLVAHLARRLGRPVRLIEDRLENMGGGDAHGPDRIFDVEVAFNDDGIVKSMKMRALDNAGAYAGRAPFQLGKPIGAIVGPYRIESVQYRAQSVTTNKAVQEAVRGFGQAPTNYAIETAIDKVAASLGLDRIEVRRRNFIRKEQFPYLIPSGSTYDSGDYHTVVDKVLAHIDFAALEKERDRLRGEGLLAGIGIAACLEPSGGNSAFEPLLNEKNTTTTWMDSCRINIDGLGFVTVTIHTTSSGQGHETLVATVIGEVLQIEPDLIRVVRPDSLACLPSNTPVGSRMAIMLGGAAFHAAQKLKTKLTRIGAHQFGLGEDKVIYAAGAVTDPRGGKQLGWAEIVNIAHRNYHLLPEGMEPGLESTHVMQVPTGERLPKDGRVQMYPCHSFEFHVVLMAIDPELGKPEIRRYVIGHDCGTVINPHIVKGMTLGGIAHGLGAALLEEFVYNGEGQLITQSFMDYLLPSAHEVPEVEIVHHCTPSPFTVFGQKGSGESGYLGAPAAISAAVNDCVASLGISFNKLPIRISAIGDAIAEAQQPKPQEHAT